MTHKINGQVQALREYFEVQLVYPRYSSRMLMQIFYLLKFQAIAVRMLTKSPYVYYRHSSALALLNMSLLIFRRNKLFVEINSSPEEYARKGKYIQAILSALFDKMVFRRAERIVTFIAEIEDQLKQIAPLAKVRVVPNGYDKPLVIQPPSSEMQSLVKELRKLKDRHYIGVMVSYFNIWHGVDLIIEIIAEMENVHLVLVGDGPELAKIQKLVKSMHLGSRVHFTGFRKLNDIAAIYSIADFGFGAFASERINLSRLPSLKIREYIAYGIPVVIKQTSALDSTPSYLHNFETIGKFKLFLSTVRSIDKAEIAANAQSFSWKNIMKFALLENGTEYR